MLSLELCKRPLSTELPTAEAEPELQTKMFPERKAVLEEHSRAAAESSANDSSSSVPPAGAKMPQGQAVAKMPQRQAEMNMTQGHAGVNGLQVEAGANIPQATGTDAVAKAAPAVPVRGFLRYSTRRLILLACIVLCIRIFVGEASVVPTASMEGTILVGDHLFMDKLLYGPEIPLVHWRLPAVKGVHRGDIIVFRYPKDVSETFLKRVAAVGGDRLEIRNGLLYVNSQPVLEPYAVHIARLHNPEENWGPIVVPEGKLFVMGDNRDNSSDSRDWGFVPIGNVIGEPLFVYWSYDAPTSRWLDENPGHRISFYASIAENFFSNTRWNRTGMLL